MSKACGKKELGLFLLIPKTHSEEPILLSVTLGTYIISKCTYIVFSGSSLELWKIHISFTFFKCNLYTVTYSLQRKSLSWPLENLDSELSSWAFSTDSPCQLLPLMPDVKESIGCTYFMSWDRVDPMANQHVLRSFNYWRAHPSIFYLLVQQIAILAANSLFGWMIVLSFSVMDNKL